MIVDDEALIRESVQISLESKGWMVIKAENAVVGLDMAKKYQPDAILLDVSMPEMHGVAALKELQGDDTTRQIPVIMLTALSGVEDHRLYDELGATWLIFKPFVIVGLQSQVEVILGWNAQQIIYQTSQQMPTGRYPTIN